MKDFVFINPDIITTIGVFILILLFVTMFFIRKYFELKEELTEIKSIFTKEVIRLEKYELDRKEAEEKNLIAESENLIHSFKCKIYENSNYS